MCHINKTEVEPDSFRVYNIYRVYMKYKKRKKIKQYIARKKKNVLSDQSSISFRVGHWHVQTINMTYQLDIRD